MGPGGPGFAVVQLMLVAAFGALCFYITQALSLGQVAGMIKLVTVFTCIGIVISAVWSAISAVASFPQRRPPMPVARPPSTRLPPQESR